MKKYIITILKAIAFFVLWIVGITICSLPSFEKPLFLNNDPAILRLWWELMPMVATLLVNIIFLRISYKDKIKINVFGSVIKDSILGISVGFIWIMITLCILTYIGCLNITSKNTITHIWVWVLAILLNVIMQEYLVRGYLFQMIKEKCNTITSILITTIIFTALHGGAFEAGFIPVLNVITMSMFISFLLIYTKNLLAPIIAHFIWNTVGGLLFGSISLADDYPNVWNSTFNGNILISGGSAKVEGSIVVLIINIILIIIFVILSANQHRVNILHEVNKYKV